MRLESGLDGLEDLDGGLKEFGLIGIAIAKLSDDFLRIRHMGYLSIRSSRMRHPCYTREAFFTVTKYMEHFC